MRRKRVVLICTAGALGLGALGLGSALAQAGGPAVGVPAMLPVAGQPVLSESTQGTADHTTFEILQQEFKTGPEVTAACLTCHTNASKHIMQTSHWSWLCPNQRAKLPDGQKAVFGKGERVINNFCIAVASNEPRCTSCHIGYGWTDKNFDFDDETLVDCLVCHDQTGKYKKFPTAAGHPVYESTPMEKREWPKGSGKFWEPAPLAEIAQHVGKPTRDNCGVCHFFGGGGEGVKHGDMDVTLSMPSHDLDVHMSPDGANMHCVDCHTTHEHKIAGRCFEEAAYKQRAFVVRGSPAEDNMLACESCHTTAPHTNAVREGIEVAHAERLDAHTDRVSCQACHIPTMAREKATKMWWDWSKAGEKNEDGTPKVVKAETRQGNRPDGKVEQTSVYDMQKGEFIWAMDAKPEYRWFNGNTKQLFVGMKVDDVTTGRELGKVTGEFSKLDLDKPVIDINTLLGDAGDPNARIWPVKVHRGIQPYDRQTKALVVPKLFPSGPDAGEAYWKAFDWEKAVVAGMAYINEEYSGELGWIQTEMNWPLAHMVAPADQAVACVECHSPDGRLAGLEGVYLPGRDRNGLIEYAGMGLIGLTLLGAVSHGVARIFTSGSRK